eukprot:8354858-Pyramimonas_sp.AAC.1
MKRWNTIWDKDHNPKFWALPGVLRACRVSPRAFPGGGKMALSRGFIDGVRVDGVEGSRRIANASP